MLSSCQPPFPDVMAEEVVLMAAGLGSDKRMAMCVVENGVRAATRLQEADRKGHRLDRVRFAMELRREYQRVGARRVKVHWEESFVPAADVASGIQSGPLTSRYRTVKEGGGFTRSNSWKGY